MGYTYAYRSEDHTSRGVSKRQQAMENMQLIPFFTGSSPFIEELKKRTFKNADEVVQIMAPENLTAQYLLDNGFTFPIVLNSTDGLDLVVPPFDNWSDLEEYVGADTEVEVIDVESQGHLNLEFSTFLRYMKKPKRHKILNLISLECSSNGLNNLIEPPNVAKELDWTMKFWPLEEEESRPKVQKYCLISPKNSYTDFHIDFGGTSVWYHIVRGEKTFYIIRPSKANTSLYWNWSESRNRLHTFFADQVDECFKCTLRAGQTLFLPTGWIHAVLTTEDSLVYGGNFLHSRSIEEQLAVYSMETKFKTPMKYTFPHFEDLHWLVGQGLLTELENLNRKQVPAPKYLLNGLKTMSHYLRQWLPNERMFFEDPIEANHLLKDLSKQVRISERIIQILNPPKPERGSTRTRKRPVHEDFIDYSIFRKKTPKRLLDDTTPAKTTKEMDWHILNGGLKLMLKRGNTELMESPSTSSGIRHDYADSRAENFSSNFACLMETTDEDEEENPLQIVEFPEFKPLYSPKTHENPLTPSSSGLSSFSMLNKIVKNNKYFKLSSEPAYSRKDTSPEECRNSIQEKPTYQPFHFKMETEGPSTPKLSSTSRAKLSSQKKHKNLYHEDSHIDSHVVHQDDDYIYPSLELTDEENDESLSTQEKEDEAWNPKAKVGKVLPRTDRPSRIGKQKIAVEKVLEAAAATPSSSKILKVHPKKKKRKPLILKGTTPLHVRSSLPGHSVHPTAKNSPKPKKGLATPKQRLDGPRESVEYKDRRISQELLFIDGMF